MALCLIVFATASLVPLRRRFDAWTCGRERLFVTSRREKSIPWLMETRWLRSLSISSARRLD